MAVCKHIKIIHFWFSALLWLCWLCCKPALDSVSQTKTEKGNEEQAIIACACPFRTLQYKWSWSLQQNWKYPGEIHMPDSPQVRHSLLAKSIRNLLCITILLEYPAVPTSICMCPTLSCYLSLKCTAKMHRWRMHFSPCQEEADTPVPETGTIPLIVQQRQDQKAELLADCPTCCLWTHHTQRPKHSLEDKGRFVWSTR